MRNAKTLLAALIAFTSTASMAQETGADAQALAKQLANPIASLISVPLQLNYDQGFGPGDGEKLTLNVQPVIPFDLTKELTVVSRTIVPVTWQNDIASPTGEQFGLGDTLQSFFLVPPTRDTPFGRFTWGVGPAITLPTSTDELLGLGTFGLGPTGVFLVQPGPVTVGALAGHQWGVAETRDDVPEVDSTFFQPFFAYTTPGAWTLGANIEGGYNWTSDDLSLPINLTVAKLTDIGGQRVQVQVGLRYWAESPDNGPDGFGGRLAVTLLFPR